MKGVVGILIGLTLMLFLVNTVSAQSSLSYTNKDIKEISTKCISTTPAKDHCITIIELPVKLNSQLVRNFKFSEKGIFSNGYEKNISEKEIPNIKGMTYKIQGNRLIIEGDIEPASQTYWGFETDMIRWDSTWWNSTWERRIPVNVTNGYGDTLTNYTAYIPITLSDLTGEANDCSDFRALNNGTVDAYEIPFEIEECNQTEDIARLWVKVPTINGSFYLYYDNDAAANGQRATEVWEDYMIVYHMNENSGTDVGNSINDSGNGTSENNAVPYETGKYGWGIDCGGGDDDQIDTNYKMPDLDSFTIEMWIKPDAQLDGSVGVIATMYDSLYAEADKHGVSYFYYGITTDRYQMETDPGSTSANELLFYDPGTTDWHHIVQYYTGTEVYMYYDGQQVGYDSSTGDVQAFSYDLLICDMGTRTYPFNGKIDEFRFLDGNYDTNFINATYDGLTVGYMSEEQDEDTTPPNVFWATSNDTLAENQTYAVFEWNVTEDIGLCYIQVNDTTNQSGTAVNDTANSYCYYNDTSLSGNVTRCGLVAYGSDASDNWNDTGTDTICLETDEQQPTNPPNIDWADPTSENGTLTTDQTYIVWNFTTNSDIWLGYVEINGSNQTATCMNDTADTYCYYNQTGIAANITACADAHASNGTVTWNTTNMTICIDTDIQVPVVVPALANAIISIYNVVWSGKNFIGILAETFTSESIIIQPRTQAPSSPVEGQIYYNSGTHKMYYWDSTTWQEM